MTMKATKTLLTIATSLILSNVVFASTLQENISSYHQKEQTKENKFIELEKELAILKEENKQFLSEKTKIENSDLEFENKKYKFDSIVGTKCSQDTKNFRVNCFFFLRYIVKPKSFFSNKEYQISFYEPTERKNINIDFNVNDDTYNYLISQIQKNIPTNWQRVEDKKALQLTYELNFLSFDVVQEEIKKLTRQIEKNIQLNKKIEEFNSEYNLLTQHNTILKQIKDEFPISYKEKINEIFPQELKTYQIKKIQYDILDMDSQILFLLLRIDPNK